MSTTLLSQPAPQRRSASRASRPAVQQRLPMLHEPAPKLGRLPPLKFVQRRGPVLRPNPLSGVVHAEVDGLNLMPACASRCTFCYARAYPSHGAEEVAALYIHSAEQLAAELRERRHLPRAVYLSPSTEPFPHYREVQEEACRVVETLAGHGVDAWIMTRGFIRPFALERLARQRKHIRFTIPLTTLDRRLQRELEPLTASPRMRLKQLVTLQRLGIRVQAAVEPLLPGLTDTRANLEPLLDALAEAGAVRITVGYAFLRHGIRANLSRELPHELADSLLAEYDGGPVLPQRGLAPAQHLPRRDRERGYGLVMTLASQRGISVSVSALTNPDFAVGPELPARHSRRHQVEFA